ncbi:MAG: cytidylate kinase-like family protein [Microgenomates group bacterium]|nr:cytidylate kinase-like family protein [Microgenomates group bacterium]
MKKFFDLINKNLFQSSHFPFWQKKIANKELPIITISREAGSGGKIIANKVAQKLGSPWKVYHKEIVNQIAKEAKLEKELISEVDEKHIPLIDEIIFDVFGKRYLSLSTYYKHLIKILSTIANRGYAIIVGRGGEYLLPSALKIRIICEMEQRIKWMMQFEKLTKQQAIERINLMDKKRNEFIKSIYGHDARKAHHYDLVIRTGKNLSLDDATDLIVALAKRRFKL